MVIPSLRNGLAARERSSPGHEEVSLMSCRMVSVAEWDALHSDYKLVRSDGSRWAMLEENGGLELVVVLDGRDLAILNGRIEAYTSSAGPAEGDWVEFA